MEWIRISTNKLKIMLTAEDARRYALNCNEADYADLLTREAFRDILVAVREKSGFDTSDDKIYIQMYPSKEGGCELFITRLGRLAAGAEKKEHGSERGEDEKPPCKRTAIKKRSAAFLFERLEDLTALCRRLAIKSYIGESEVWRDEKGLWWIILSENGNPLSVRDDYRFAREYGQMLPAEYARALLPEHGKCICPDNAVDTFARF